MTEWIESAGGPLIAIPIAHVGAWRGASSRAEGPSDYERACEVNEYIGLLKHDGNDVLVLGDEPHRTCWIARADGGLLVRWIYAESEADALTAVGGISVEKMRDIGVRFSARGPYRLMDAADPGDDPAQGSVEMAVMPGRYRVLETFVDADKSTRLLVHAVLLD